MENTNSRGRAKLVRREAEQLGRTLAEVEHRRHEDMVRALKALQDGYVYAVPLTAGSESEVRLRFLAEFLALGDGMLSGLVEDARAEGVTWTRIGELLGVSRQAVTQRFGRAA